MEIPDELKRESFRFVKIRRGEKGPFEKRWQVENNYAWNDPEFQCWDGNFGVVCGYGDLVVIDADKQELVDAITDNLPKTLVVKTGGGGFHFYYIIPDLDEPIRLSDEKPGDIGDIQSVGKQVVGPKSIHPNGREYEIVRYNEIAEISAEDLRRVLGEWIKGVEKSRRWEDPVYRERLGDIPIEAVVDLGGLKRRGDEYFGEHPIHGSTTGRNFWVNTEKDTWYCFRDSAGGGPLLWLAVREGIIDCSEAGPGALDDPEKFSQVLEVAEREGLITSVEKDTTRATWRFGPIKVVVGREEDGWTFQFEDENGETVGRRLEVPMDKGLSDYYQGKLRNRLSEPFEYGILEEPDDFNFDKSFVRLVIGMQDNLPSEKKEEEKPEEVDKELDRKAEDLLHSTRLLLRIDDAIHDFMASEHQNAMANFLTYASTLTDDPINLRWSARSSVGKSAIATATIKPFPDEWKMVYVGMTEKSIYYAPDAEEVGEHRRELDLTGKILLILEEDNAREFLDEIRPLLSHDEREHVYCFTDTSGKKPVRREIVLKGWPAYVGLSVSPELSFELRTREWMATPEMGKDKYGRVVDWKAMKAFAPWIEEDEERLEVIKKALSKLERLEVWIPYIPIIRNNFSTKFARSQRDWDKLESSIKTVTLLHQYQRDRIKVDDKEMIIAEPFDGIVATLIMEPAISQAVSGFNRDQIKFYEHICKKSQKEEIFEWTYRDLMEEYDEVFGEPITRATMQRRYVDPYVGAGVMDRDESQKAHLMRVISPIQSSNPSNLEELREKLSDLEIDEDYLYAHLCTANRMWGRNPPPDITKWVVKGIVGSQYEDGGTGPSVSLEEDVISELKYRFFVKDKKESVNWEVEDLEDFYGEKKPKLSVSDLARGEEVERIGDREGGPTPGVDPCPTGFCEECWKSGLKKRAVRKVPEHGTDVFMCKGCLQAAGWED